MSDSTEIIAKTTPALVMTAWGFWGFTLNEWAAITAIVYTALMTIFLLVDRFKKWRKEREAV